MNFPIATAEFMKDPGVRFFTFILSTLMLAAITLLFFFAGTPEVTKTPEELQPDVCSKNLSADDYQTCQVIISEGGTY